jgi:non-canonical (house-cleaning) NTP pyrophosphatase
MKRVLGYGTMGTAKINALYAALLRLGADRFRVSPSDAPSLVDAQPIGWEMGELGAENRAFFSLAAEPEADYGLGVESYFERRRTLWLDLAAVAVVERSTMRVVAQSTSVGVAMPERYVLEAIRRGTQQWTAGQVFAEEHPGVKACDWHGAVTGGLLGREGLMADALYAALVQVHGL